MVEFECFPGSTLLGACPAACNFRSFTPSLSFSGRRNQAFFILLARYDALLYIDIVDHFLRFSFYRAATVIPNYYSIVNATQGNSRNATHVKSKKTQQSNKQPTNPAAVPR